MSREEGHVLVPGAGGRLELRAFAEAHPGWRFNCVDPAAAPMLDLVGDAPEGPFDGATCLLTLHFMDLAERRRSTAEIHRRLKPGAPYVFAHLSFPQGEGADGDRALWLSRHEAYLAAAGLDAGRAKATRTAIDTKTHIFAPTENETILRETGFANVSLFYASFSFPGWVAYA